VKGAGLETGLRHRLRRAVRQMREQHVHFEPLADALRRAGAAGSVEELRRALAHYAEALGAHFSLESEVFFPALHGLHPERSRELEALEREHEELLAELRGIGGGAGRAAPASLDAFFDVLRAHERREEGLASELAELAGAGGA
jgi:hypothetical protein